VADVEGLVIARVDKGSVADLAGLAPGHLITAVDNTPVTRGVQLRERLEAKRPGEQVSLQVTAPGGSPRTVQVPVSVTPRVISPNDQTLLFNPLSVVLRNRLLTADAADQPIVRLNLAVALMRLGDYAGAREQLEAVQLPDTTGIGHGTQQYLLGLAYEGMGDVAAAQRAWQAAAATQAWLTEDGPPVQGLAERKLGAAGRPGTP
jgi:membrane-associated protease RseP (regulator of RpoE activity)